MQGLAPRLRSRAMAMLDNTLLLRGAGRGHHHARHPPLLRAWAGLNELRYFWAPPSSVRRCQLCVAMYQACEIQLLSQRSVPAEWLEGAAELAAAMPVPPSSEWLGGLNENSKAPLAEEETTAFC